MMYRERLLISSFIFVLCSSWISDAHAATLSDVAIGSATPATSNDQSAVVTNGDFEIFRSSPLPPGNRGFPIGDGINDFTRWVFDLTQDPDYGSFDFSAPIVSATLEFDLIPMGEDFSSDFVRFDGFANVPLNTTITPAQIGSPMSVTVDLLSVYGSASILNYITSNNGLLSMRYEDDAILTRAEIQITSSVPEPSSLLMLSIGGAFLARRRREAKSV